MPASVLTPGSTGLLSVEEENFAFDVRSRKRKLPTGSAKLREIKASLERSIKEVEVLREEMSEIRKADGNHESALGFDLFDYLAMDDTESSIWITDQLAKTLKEKISEKKAFFEPLEMVRGCQSVEAEACTRYNRGENCSSHWHFVTKLENPASSLSCNMLTGEELRLHCCVLCLEALDVISGHPLVQCPWVRKETWNKLEQKSEKDDEKSTREEF